MTAAVSKGTQAVKLCSNKIFQVLTGDAGQLTQVNLYYGHKTVVEISHNLKLSQRIKNDIIQ